jgi:hypothetical protein
MANYKKLFKESLTPHYLREVKDSKTISTKHLDATIFKDGGMKLRINSSNKSPYGYTKRDLIKSPFGVPDEKFTFDYIKKEIDEVYTKFPDEEIKELLNKVDQYKNSLNEEDRATNENINESKFEVGDEIVYRGNQPGKVVHVFDYQSYINPSAEYKIKYISDSGNTTTARVRGKEIALKKDLDDMGRKYFGKDYDLEEDINENKIPSFLTKNKAFEKAVGDSVSYNDFEKRVYGILGPKYYKLTLSQYPGVLKDFYDSVRVTKPNMEEELFTPNEMGDEAVEREASSAAYESLQESLRKKLQDRLK